MSGTAARRRRLLLPIALSLAAGPAAAHGNLPGGGGFLSGLLHPFVALPQLVLLLSLGLLLGRIERDRRGVGLAMLALGFAGGLSAVTALSDAPLVPSLAAAAILALALAAGLLLALDLPPPRAVLAALGLSTGLLIGLDTDVAAAATWIARLAPALGVLAGTFLIVLDAAAASAWAQRPPFPIARRVAGSWLAAVALMLLALAWAAPGSAA